MLNRIKMMLLLAGVLGAFAAVDAQATTVPFSESFDSGVAGWENSVNNPLTFGATGGSDGGGYASGTFNYFGFANPFGGPLVLRASAADNASGGAFIGNWTTSGVGTVTAMVRHNAPEALNFYLRIATASNFPGGVFQSTQNIVANVWTQVTFQIVPSSSFCTDEGPPGSSCPSALAAVGNFQIGTSAPAGLLDDNVAYTIDIDQVSLLPIPEPGTACLLGLGLAGIAWSGRRRSAA